VGPAAESCRSVAAESCRSMAISIKIATFWKTVQTWVSDHHARIVQSAKSTTAGARSQSFDVHNLTRSPRQADVHQGGIWISVEIQNSSLIPTYNRYRYYNGNLFFDKDQDGEINDSELNPLLEEDIRDEYALKVYKQLNEIIASNDELLQKKMHDLENSQNIHIIKASRKKGHNEARIPESKYESALRGDPMGSFIDYDPDCLFPNNNEQKPSRPPVVALVHELLGHSWDWDQGLTKNGLTENGIPLNEINAINLENRMRRALKIEIRTKFAGKDIDPKYLD
jgi:hypothetical protein